MRVLGSLALLSAAFVQGEWTEDMGAELRMLQASNSSNSSSAATGTTGASNSSSAATTAGGSSSSGNATTTTTGGSSSSATSTSGNATTSTTTTSTTTTTTAAGNTTTTTTTTGGASTDVEVLTTFAMSVTNISAASAQAMGTFATALKGEAKTTVCAVSAVTGWTAQNCASATQVKVDIGKGTGVTPYSSAYSRRQLASHSDKDKVTTSVKSMVPPAKANLVKTEVKNSVDAGANSGLQKSFADAALIVVNANSAALGVNNVSIADLGLSVTPTDPVSSTTSGASSVSAFFAFAFASAAAALFMF